MKLTTDLAIKKWKPNSEGERTSCGQSLYVQGYSNGKRSWVYRLQIGTGSSKRSIWLKIGQPALGSEHGIAGGALRLAEARELAMRISGAVKRGETSADQVKRALDITAPLNEFDNLLSKPVIGPAAEIDYGKIPTFDEMFRKWYKMQMAANRWTHKASIQRPIGAYENHAAKAFGYLPINQITRRMVFETLQDLFLEHYKTGKDLHCYCNEVFELAVDLEIIDSNPCPHKKKFTKPKRKVAHHGTIAASELPNLYQHVMNGKFDATFKAAMIALVVSGLRVANIAYLRQEHYNPATGRFTIPEKDDDNPMVGLMKTGNEYSNIFPPEVRDMINEQLLAGHEFVFVSRHSKRLYQTGVGYADIIR
jgi:site-specific recombinase XerD